MADNPGISLEISAQDEASKEIQKLQKRLDELKGKVGGVGKSLEKSTKSVGGLRDLGAGMGDLSRTSQAAFQNIGNLVPQLGVLTGAASVAGLMKLTSSFADFGSKVGFSAQRAGASVQQMSSLQGAARLAGGSADDMTQSLTTLNDNLMLAANGRAPEFQNALSRMGVSMWDANGKLKTGAAMMPELADVIAKTTDVTLKNIDATQTMGGAAGNLIPLWNKGGAGLAAYQAKAVKYGAITKKQAEAANELREKQEELTQSAEGLRNTIGERLNPVLGPMLVNLATWIDANREVIATGLAEFVRDVVPPIVGLAKGINTVVTSTIGWKGAGELLIMAFALSKLRGIALGIKAIGLELANPVVLAALTAWMAYQKYQELNKLPTTQGEYDDRMRQIPAGSPMWNGYSREDASNYVNSNQSQEFFRQTRGNANDYSPWNPGSWLGRRDGKGPLAAINPGPTTPDQPFTGTHRQYVQATYERLLRAGQERGVEHPEIIARLGAAQSSIETGNGRHFAAANNAYGIKAGGGVGGVGEPVGTDEVINGQRVRQQARFATFANKDDAARGYVDFLLKNPRYRDVLRAGSDQEAAHAMGQTGYATDPKYEATIAGIMRGVQQAAPVQIAQAGGAPAQVGNGTGASAARQETTVRGSADVTVSLKGFPRGTQTAATTSGPLFGAPKVEQAFPLG